MRKLTVAEFISLDGVVEAPDTWHFPYLNDEMMAVIGEGAAASDTMLLGRVTYESFAGAFADLPEDDPTGAMMNRPRKVVVSRSATSRPSSMTTSSSRPSASVAESSARFHELSMKFRGALERSK